MKDDRLNELLERCESPIERKLLRNLYPHLTADSACELRAQYMIDGLDFKLVTVPDFAFPDMQIAIYCDGFKWHAGDWYKFRRDRLQLRELQLGGWIVLRFAGSEIHRDGDMVIDTIQRAIDRRNRQPEWWSQQQDTLLALRDKGLAGDLELHSGREAPFSQQKPEGGLCGVIFLASVIVGVLVLLDFIF